jgi:hypothetical protein
MMLEFIAMNLGLLVFLIFILFFVLMIVIKDKTFRSKIIKVLLAIVLGGLVFAGILVLFTGIRLALHGEFGTGQLLIQIGTGLLFITGGGIPLYVFFIAKQRSAKRLERRKKEYPYAP